jgi:hypothetical protein
VLFSPDKDETYEFELREREQHHRKILLIFLTIIFLVAIFKIPPIHYIKSTQLNHTHSLQANSSFDNNIHTLGQCRRYAISIINCFYLLISIFIVLIFSYLLKKEKRAENYETPVSQEPGENGQRTVNPQQAENNGNSRLGIVVLYFS